MFCIIGLKFLVVLSPSHTGNLSLYLCVLSHGLIQSYSFIAIPPFSWLVGLMLLFALSMSHIEALVCSHVS